MSGLGFGFGFECLKHCRDTILKEPAAAQRSGADPQQLRTASAAAESCVSPGRIAALPRGSGRSPRASRLGYAVPPALASPPAAGLQDRRPPQSGDWELRLSKSPQRLTAASLPSYPLYFHLVLRHKLCVVCAPLSFPHPPTPLLRTQTHALLVSAPLRSPHRDRVAVPASPFPGGERLSFPHPGNRGPTFTVTSLSPTRSKGVPHLRPPAPASLRVPPAGLSAFFLSVLPFVCPPACLPPFLFSPPVTKAQAKGGIRKNTAVGSRSINTARRERPKVWNERKKAYGDKSQASATADALPMLGLHGGGQSPLAVCLGGIFSGVGRWR